MFAKYEEFNYIYGLCGGDPTKYDELMNCPWCDIHATRMYNIDLESFNRNMAEYQRLKATREDKN